MVVQVKALACELPATLGLPLSRLSVSDVAQQARQLGLVATISDSTVWRWLNADAIRPWQHRCWIFPRDAQFAVKAGRILDLYQRVPGFVQHKPKQFGQFHNGFSSIV